MRAMRADLLVRLPELLSDASAAALLLKGMTAGFLLHDVAQGRRGSLVFVHAAAGGGGQILCHWAQTLGAVVIGATSSEAKADLTRSVGCDPVMGYRREEFPAAVRRA